MICGSLKDSAQLNQAGEGFADLQPLKVEKKVWTNEKLDKPSVRMKVRIKMPLQVCQNFGRNYKTAVIVDRM